ncbi:MAG: large conductance mechanosensitive channel protein MscL [Planctomycetaceae bacterium]|nr:large conductance mechanosensitive channel protein MscL [Planctomycetaceae bacterium]
MSFLKEFRNFAVKGNAVDMAVGVVIGAAFAGVVTSLVKDIFNPLLGVLTFQDFSSLAFAINGNEVKYGDFINAVLNFMIISFAVFIVVRQMNRVRIPFLFPDVDAPTTKPCPFCCSAIPFKASRCPNCTSELGDSSSSTEIIRE